MEKHQAVLHWQDHTHSIFASFLKITNLNYLASYIKLIHIWIASKKVHNVNMVFQYRLTTDSACVNTIVQIVCAYKQNKSLLFSCFLERFSQRRSSGNHCWGRETKTKRGRKWLPGFRLHHMRAGFCLDDEWRVIYLVGFLLMLCLSILALGFLTSLRLWCTMGDLYVLYVTWDRVDR